MKRALPMRLACLLALAACSGAATPTAQPSPTAPVAAPSPTLAAPQPTATVGASSPAATGTRSPAAQSGQAGASPTPRAAARPTTAPVPIRAVATKIDECHTNFLDPDQYQQVTASLEGKQTYGGIGASLRPSTHPTVIGEVFPGTPAEKAGLKPGDMTLAVNDTDVSDLTA